MQKLQTTSLLGAILFAYAIVAANDSRAESEADRFHRQTLESAARWQAEDQRQIDALRMQRSLEAVPPIIVPARPLEPFAVQPNNPLSPVLIYDGERYHRAY